MKGGEKITQISLISSIGNLAAVPKSGAGSGVAPLFASKFGDLFGASFGTVLAKKIAPPAVSLQADPLAALQALSAIKQPRFSEPNPLRKQRGHPTPARRMCGRQTS
ncbi:MAG: hypothetical protein ACYDA1_02200 [Vulcanimicrobiaceae bacterium]